MVSVQELLRGARDLPGDSPARDAEILLGHCLDKPRSWLYTWP
ncbi:MAG: protein-(glutamine-N5) methyltransferase, release factor-specific, partial [Halieaceae bacterium]|nr:protein-(glutamine-N5) methyltransferase, release factor-specific [Halieaceae bacterium]